MKIGKKINYCFYRYGVRISQKNSKTLIFKEIGMAFSYFVTLFLLAMNSKLSD